MHIARNPANELVWQRAVHDVLRRRYVRSRRQYLVSCPSPMVSFADTEVDGQGGSAILTELQHMLGKVVLQHRNLFKHFVLRSAHALGWPVHQTPAGHARVGCRVSKGKSKRTLLDYLIDSLPLPDHVRTSYLCPLLGEAWWGVRSTARLPRCKSYGSFAVCVPRPKKTLRDIFRFPCTLLHFSTGIRIVAEWRAGGDFISLRTTHIWTFVFFLRQQRNKSHHPSEVIHIGGLGDVFV